MDENGQDVSLKTLLDQIVNTKKDLRNTIEASKARLILNIELRNLEIRKKEKDNLQNNIENLKGKEKKKQNCNLWY